MTKNSSLRPEVDVDHILTFFAVTYSLESHSNLKRFTNPIRQPEDDINQFVACSEKFARLRPFYANFRVFPHIRFTWTLFLLDR